MRTRIIATLALLGSLAGTAAAETTPWGTPASGCMPDQSSIANQRFVSSATTGNVAFAPGKTGTITLACRVRHPLGSSSNTIGVTYKDGWGGTCGDWQSTVSVSYIRTSTDGSGAGATLASFVAQNSSAARSEHTQGFTPSGNTNDDLYWVQIQITRWNTACDVKAFGARLFTP
jgi:hypothetical protein